ncbi:MAG: hypothetical protein DIZ80_00435 [endosymbiont of Galathealinum brachiosum]|uniref:Uncharacterized protein n=1 Tax=endosymbiont of Galathealinum brachiosum TaxID=2200906 RepID=A0A370DM30_9GAMM|nr:MAG: hypothetical protein DIZ80_00435 [endosymbiont of Galathealinum brachiosum]
MIKLTLFLPLLAFFSACSNASDNITPEFNSVYFTGLESTKVENYKEAILDYDLTSPDEKNLHFTNCTQVDALKETDVAMHEFHLYTMLKANCKALKLYTKAKASTTTYLSELLVKKNIGNLPATAYPFVNTYDKSTRANKTLSSHQKKLEYKTMDDGSIDVTTETDTLLYQILSTGDFNNDSIQDAIIRIDWHVLNAFGKGSKLVMISRLSKDDEFTEVDF